MNLKNIIIFTLLISTFAFATIGNPDNVYWSGSYFIINYVILFTMFSREFDKKISYVGMALSATILLYVLLKYFFNFEYNRLYNLLVFGVALGSIIYIERKNWLR